MVSSFAVAAAQSHWRERAWASWEVEMVEADLSCAMRAARILEREGPAACMMGRRSGVIMRRFAKVAEVEVVMTLAGLGAWKRSVREGTWVDREGVRNYELSRDSGAGSAEKPDRAMCSILSLPSASPTVPTEWREMASPVGKGVVMRIKRKGELRSMF